MLKPFSESSSLDVAVSSSSLEKVTNFLTPGFVSSQECGPTSHRTRSALSRSGDDRRSYEEAGHPQPGHHDRNRLHPEVGHAGACHSRSLLHDARSGRRDSDLRRGSHRDGHTPGRRSDPGTLHGGNHRVFRSCGRHSGPCIHHAVDARLKKRLA